MGRSAGRGSVAEADRPEHSPYRYDRSVPAAATPAIALLVRARIAHARARVHAPGAPRRGPRCAPRVRPGGRRRPRHRARPGWARRSSRWPMASSSRRSCRSTASWTSRPSPRSLAGVAPSSPSPPPPSVRRAPWSAASVPWGCAGACPWSSMPACSSTRPSSSRPGAGACSWSSHRTTWCGRRGRRRRHRPVRSGSGPKDVETGPGPRLSYFCKAPRPVIPTDRASNRRRRPPRQEPVDRVERPSTPGSRPRSPGSMAGRPPGAHHRAAPHATSTPVPCLRRPYPPSPCPMHGVLAERRHESCRYPQAAPSGRPLDGHGG